MIAMIKLSFATFVPKTKVMAGNHKEPEQNEIGGPVLLTLLLVAIVVVVIALL
jgi:hypothetical protein